MSFHDEIADCFSTIEQYDQIQIIGKHPYKGKLGYVKHIKPQNGGDNSYTIELQMNGITIECTSEQIVKF